MSTITERQSYWRDHVLAAASFDGTIVEYAQANDLKTKDIYQWKTSLTKRGFLPANDQAVTTDFVVVNPTDPADTVSSQPSSWLFSNSVAGANASANLYSLVETAKANGHEPYAYIKHVLTELPAAKTLEDVDVVLPFNVQMADCVAA